MVVPHMVMILASLFCASMFIVSLPWYKEEPMLHLVDFMQSFDYPSVDVFLLCYKEDGDLCEPTVCAALALDYLEDRLVVHVLDDGSCSAPLWTQGYSIITQTNKISDSTFSTTAIFHHHDHAHCTPLHANLIMSPDHYD